MIKCKVLFTFLVVLILLSWNVFAQSSITKFKMVTHVGDGYPEQHVFIEDSSDASRVVRVEGEAARDPANLAKATYASTDSVDDPFKYTENPLGPFTKGEALGFTLGEWLTASATGTYSVNGDKAKMNIEFQNLVPNGLYTMWCGRILIAEQISFADAACYDLSGEAVMFIAEADGSASLSFELEALAPSTEDNVQDLGIAYHSDGNTYGDSPGTFGFNSHVQLFVSVATPLP